MGEDFRIDPNTGAIISGSVSNNGQGPSFESSGTLMDSMSSGIDLGEFDSMDKAPVIGRFGLDAIQEQAYSEQSGVGMFFKGLGKVANTALFEVAKMPGYLGGLAIDGAETLLGNPDGLDWTVNNAWIRGMENLKGSLDDNLLEIHKPGDFDKKSLGAQLADPTFWATEGADGVGFLLSFLAPGQLLKAAGVGAKIAGAGGKIGAASKARLGATLSKGAAKQGTIADAARLANNIDSGLAVAINTISESAAEGSAAYKQTYDKLISQGLSHEEANAKAAEAGSAIFKMNAPLLLMSNLFLEKYVMNGFNRLSGASRRGSVLGKVTDDVITGKAAVKTLGKRATAKAIGKGAIASTLQEGLLEEGLQTSIEQSVEHNGAMDSWFQGDDWLNAFGQYFDNVASLTGEGDATKEAKDFGRAVVLGGALGSVMGTAGQVQNTNAQNRALTGGKAFKPNTFQKFIGMKEREAQKGLVDVFQENYAHSGKTRKDIFNLDDAGNITGLQEGALENGGMEILATYYHDLVEKNGGDVIAARKELNLNVAKHLLKPEEAKELQTKAEAKFADTMKDVEVVNDDAVDALRLKYQQDNKVTAEEAAKKIVGKSQNSFDKLKFVQGEISKELGQRPEAVAAHFDNISENFSSAEALEQLQTQRDLKYFLPFFQQEGGITLLNEHLGTMAQVAVNRYSENTGITEQAELDKKKSEVEQDLKEKADEFHRIYQREQTRQRNATLRVKPYNVLDGSTTDRLDNKQNRRAVKAEYDKFISSMAIEQASLAIRKAEAENRKKAILENNQALVDDFNAERQKVLDEINKDIQKITEEINELAKKHIKANDALLKKIDTAARKLGTATERKQKAEEPTEKMTQAIDKAKKELDSLQKEQDKLVKAQAAEMKVLTDSLAKLQQQVSTLSQIQPQDEFLFSDKNLDVRGFFASWKRLDYARKDIQAYDKQIEAISESQDNFKDKDAIAKTFAKYYNTKDEVNKELTQEEVSEEEAVNEKVAKIKEDMLAHYNPYKLPNGQEVAGVQIAGDKGFIVINKGVVVHLKAGKTRFTMTAGQGNELYVKNITTGKKGELTKMTAFVKKYPSLEVIPHTEIVKELEEKKRKVIQDRINRRRKSLFMSMEAVIRENEAHLADNKAKLIALKNQRDDLILESEIALEAFNKDELTLEQLKEITTKVDEHIAELVDEIAVRERQHLAINQVIAEAQEYLKVIPYEPVSITGNLKQTQKELEEATIELLGLNYDAIIPEGDIVQLQEQRAEILKSIDLLNRELTTFEDIQSQLRQAMLSHDKIIADLNEMFSEKYKELLEVNPQLAGFLKEKHEIFGNSIVSILQNPKERNRFFRHLRKRVGTNPEARKLLKKRIEAIASIPETIGVHQAAKRELLDKYNGNQAALKNVLKEIKTLKAQENVARLTEQLKITTSLFNSMASKYETIRAAIDDKDFAKEIYQDVRPANSIESSFNLENLSDFKNAHFYANALTDNLFTTTGVSIQYSIDGKDVMVTDIDGTTRPLANENKYQQTWFNVTSSMTTKEANGYRIMYKVANYEAGDEYNLAFADANKVARKEGDIFAVLTDLTGTPIKASAEGKLGEGNLVFTSIRRPESLFPKGKKPKVAEVTLIKDYLLDEFNITPSKFTKKTKLASLLNKEQREKLEELGFDKDDTIGDLIGDKFNGPAVIHGMVQYDLFRQKILSSGQPMYSAIEGLTNGFPTITKKDGKVVGHKPLAAMAHAGVKLNAQGKAEGFDLITVGQDGVLRHRNKKEIRGGLIPGSVFMSIESTGQFVPMVSRNITSGEIDVVMRYFQQIAQSEDTGSTAISLSDIGSNLTGYTFYDGKRYSGQAGTTKKGKVVESMPMKPVGKARLSVLSSIMNYGRKNIPSKGRADYDLFIGGGKIKFGKKGSLDLADLMKDGKENMEATKELREFLKTKRHHFNQDLFRKQDTKKIRDGKIPTPYFAPTGVSSDGKIMFQQYKSYADYLMKSGLTTNVQPKSVSDKLGLPQFAQRNVKLGQPSSKITVPKVVKEVKKTPAPVKKVEVKGDPKVQAAVNRLLKQPEDKLKSTFIPAMKTTLKSYHLMPDEAKDSDTFNPKGAKKPTIIPDNFKKAGLDTFRRMKQAVDILEKGFESKPPPVDDGSFPTAPPPLSAEEVAAQEIEAQVESTIAGVEAAIEAAMNKSGKPKANAATEAKQETENDVAAFGLELAAQPVAEKGTEVKSSKRNKFNKFNFGGAPTRSGNKSKLDFTPDRVVSPSRTLREMVKKNQVKQNCK